MSAISFNTSPRKILAGVPCAFISRLVGPSSFLGVSFGLSAICSLLSFALSGHQHYFSFWNTTCLLIISFLFCLLFVQLCPKGKACCLVIRNELSVIWKKCGDKRSNWLHSWFTRRSIASLSRDLLRSGAPWCSATMSFFFSLSTTITFFFPQQ